MNNTEFIKNGLYIQHLPVIESDIPYIKDILGTVEQSQMALQSFPYLSLEVPITIVDKRLLR